MVEIDDNRYDMLVELVNEDMRHWMKELLRLRSMIVITTMSKDAKAELLSHLENSWNRLEQVYKQTQELINDE